MLLSDRSTAELPAAAAGVLGGDADVDRDRGRLIIDLVQCIIIVMYNVVLFTIILYDIILFIGQPIVYCQPGRPRPAHHRPGAMHNYCVIQYCIVYCYTVLYCIYYYIVYASLERHCGIIDLVQYIIIVLYNIVLFIILLYNITLFIVSMDRDRGRLIIGVVADVSAKTEFEDIIFKKIILKCFIRNK